MQGKQDALTAPGDDSEVDDQQQIEDQQAEPNETGVEPVEVEQKKPSAQLRDLLDQDSRRADFRLPTSYEVNLPAAMSVPEVSQRVWSKWYGSRKAADRVEQILLRKPKDAQLSRLVKRLRHMEPLMALSFAFGNVHTRTDFFFNLGPEIYETIAPEYKQPEVHSDIERRYGHLAGESGTSYKSLVEMAEQVEAAWPFMAAIHDRGCFRIDTSAILLWVDRICRIIESGEVKPLDLPLLQLAINMKLSDVIPRIAALAAIYRETVAACFSDPMKLAGITCNSLDREHSIWHQIDADELEMTCRQLDLEVHSRAENVATFPSQDPSFVAVAAQIVKAARIGRQLNGLYEDYCHKHMCSEFYTAVRCRILESAQRLGMAVGSFVEQFPEGLVAREIDLSNAACMTQAFTALSALRSANRVAVESINQALDANDDQEQAISAIQQEIQQLAAQTSLASIQAITEKAAQTSALIQQSKNWLLDSLVPAANEYVLGWNEFYSNVDSLCEKVEPGPAEYEPSAKEAVEPIGPELPLISAADLVNLNERLQTALADIEHLRRERDDARQSIHKLRSQLAGKPANRAENIFQHSLDSLDSIYRVALRQGFGPADVLAFFETTAPDRLKVLPSAWQGAKGYVLPYEPAERMLEIMGNLTGPYLDALRSGQPDAQARQVLGGKVYSAKESDTTLSNARLRAMREFDFEGEKRLFVQHLRVNNEVGSRGMRIYFAVDGTDQDKQIVVAYVGPHLELQSTT